MGGLGNQMFQYAFARSLSFKLGYDLYLDLSFLNDRSPQVNFTFRDFELGVFNIVGSIIEKPPFINYENSFFRKIYFRFNNIIQLNELSFSKYKKSELLKFDIIYLDGYWQSDKYFSEFPELISRDFTLRDNFQGNINFWKSLIVDSESVSIHIRRGDYISNSHNLNFHGICSLDYFMEGIKLINKKYKMPVFYFFSDDIIWAKNNFSFIEGDKYFISGVDDFKGFHEMYLMSLCKSNIISNSSFSWWAAWLNSNLEKIVVAPKRWFLTNSVDTSDLIPKSWVRI